MLEHLWVTENRIIIPVWHNITLSEIRAYRVFLANIIGLGTDIYSRRRIADEIHEDMIASYARRLRMDSDEQ